MILIELRYYRNYHWGSQILQAYPLMAAGASSALYTLQIMHL